MMSGYADTTDRAGGATVLVADDDELVRMVLCDMLRELGYSVITAAGSEEAVEVFRERHHDIHLVILDYKMPGGSGGETFDRLRETDPEVRVLLSSGHSDTIDLDELRARGLRGFLAKPYSMERIRDKIAEIIG
jgi:CheY-like chemotaxis protein